MIVCQRTTRQISKMISECMYKSFIIDSLEAILYTWRYRETESARKIISLHVVSIEIEIYMHTAYSPSLTTCLALRIFLITLHKYIKRNKKNEKKRNEKNNILFNFITMLFLFAIYWVSLRKIKIYIGVVPSQNQNQKISTILSVNHPTIWTATMITTW